jgi:predicted Zn-dependent protease
LLRSHPATEERIADLEKLAASLKCACQSLGIDWPAVQVATRKWKEAH